MTSAFDMLAIEEQRAARNLRAYDRTKKHGARRTIERKKHMDYEL